MINNTLEQWDHETLTEQCIHVGIGVRDDEKRTLLHLISGCPPEEDIREMINLLIQQLVNFCTSCSYGTT